MKGFFSKITLLFVLLLWSCSGRPNQNRYFNMHSYKYDKKEVQNEAEMHISDALRYFELEMYEMSYNSVYNALMLLNEIKDIKDQKYNEMMDLALKINFKLRDKVRYSFAGIDKHEKTRKHLYNKDIFPVSIARDKSYLSDTFISTVYMVGSLFIPFFKNELISNDVPVEFSLLPLIESGFDSKAISPKGAVGMWQFMETTGLSLGLDINYWVDKRQDPFSSASAASSYLRYLYDRFQKWELVLAAYNCGETRLARIIDNVKSSDICVLLESALLPSETKNYVRSFLYLIDNVDLSYFGTEQQIKQIKIPFSIRVSDLLRYIDISEADFYYLNPDIKRGIIPYSDNGFIVNLYAECRYYIEDIDDKDIIHWNRVRIENDISVEELSDYLNLSRGMIMHLGNPGKDGIIKKGTSFIYPR